MKGKSELVGSCTGSRFWRAMLPRRCRDCSSFRVLCRQQMGHLPVLKLDESKAIGIQPLTSTAAGEVCITSVTL